MQTKQPQSRSMKLYSRLIVFGLLMLFVVFTAVIFVIYTLGNIDTSTLLGKAQQFLINLYPNIFTIPFAFIFSYLFFGPIRKEEQEANDERILEKMTSVLVPAVEQTFVARINEHLEPMLQATLTDVLHGSAAIQEMGIIAVRSHLNYAELRERIIQSKERVYLCDTRVFYQLKEFDEAFQQTALHEVPLRILMLDPKSAVAKQRSMDVYMEKGQLEHVSRLTVAVITTFYKKMSLKNIELRFHSTMPSMQIFICDNEAMVGFYFYGQDSQVSIQLEVLIKDKKGEYTPLGKQIETEFERRWNQGLPAQL